MQQYKITRKFKPVIQSNGKVKRIGRAFYEVAFYTNAWHFKEFDTLQAAKAFVA